MNDSLRNKTFFILGVTALKSVGVLWKFYTIVFNFKVTAWKLHCLDDLTVTEQYSA